MVRYVASLPGRFYENLGGDHLSIVESIYQHRSEKHLHRYLAGYDFGYSNRNKLGCYDKERSNCALLGVSGKRLTCNGAGLLQIMQCNGVGLLQIMQCNGVYLLQIIKYAQ